MLELLWLLDMFAGHRLVPAGIWNEEQRIGRLLDLDRPLLEPSKSAMPKRTSLPHYLDQVLPRWQSLDEDGRHATKVSISIYAALPVDLEPAVVVGGMGLEHLAEALLPKKANSYDVPKVQRQVISRGCASWPTRLLLEHSGAVTWTCWWAGSSKPRLRPCRRALPEVRRGDEPGRAQGLRLFERHAIATVLLRHLGYNGPIWDARQARRLDR